MLLKKGPVLAAAVVLPLFSGAAFLGASWTVGPAAAMQRGSAAGMNRSEIEFESAAERRAWEAVVESQNDKPGRARAFLAEHPGSIMAAEAHYLLALDALEHQAVDRFDNHARGALKEFPRLVRRQPGQCIRWLSLLAQLGFVESETGRLESARTSARELLRLVDDTQPGQGWTRPAWEAMIRQLRASAHYILGRSQLGAEDGLAEAILHLERAVHFNPLDDYAYYRLGQALNAAGREAEAGRNLARAALLEGVAGSAASQLLGRTLSPDEKRTLLEEQATWLDGQLKLRPSALFALADGVPHPAYWVHAVPREVRHSSFAGSDFSNIRRLDYSGPESCQACHPLKYQDWATHSHRWMNASAGPQTVKGDFDDKQVRYLGGKADFVRQGENYRMRLARGRLKRTYAVTRTIGSRFFQYYVGRQIEGPETAAGPPEPVEEVLPFGYWLGRRQWVPVVHIDEEMPDGQRRDPFSASLSPVAYDRNCSACHTTRPIGDWMLTTDGRLRLGAFAPHDLNFLFTPYLAEAHPEIYDSTPASRRWAPRRFQDLLVEKVDSLPAPEHAVNLGVSCEACHNGARLHIEQSTPRETKNKPRFFPSSPWVWIETSLPREGVFGRTPDNLNWICGRCHSGGRPRYAGGMDTWNSTEASDAFRSDCYDGEKAEAAGLAVLTCVQCHDPHKSIGKKWDKSPADDDQRCLSCHRDLEGPQARSSHTHHSLDSAGSRCMNCHMPRINEGLEEMVRTHRIFSPSEPRMLESNQPNACNLCHLDQSVAWTRRHLDRWYGTSFLAGRNLEEDVDEAGPAALEWLRGSHPPTRLAASDALTRSRSKWALPALIEMLDDPYLINRQFTQKGIEEMLGVDLEDYGYRFYQMPAERRRPLERIRKGLIETPK